MHQLTVIQNENRSGEAPWLTCVYINTIYTSLFSSRNNIHYFMESSLLSQLWEIDREREGGEAASTHLVQSAVAGW